MLKQKAVRSLYIRTSKFVFEVEGRRKKVIARNKNSGKDGKEPCTPSEESENRKFTNKHFERSSWTR